MRSETKPTGQRAATMIRDAERSFIERARRAQIVEAAIATIAEVGYGRASLAAIARRAGVSKSALMYHFAGKDELTERVVAEVYEAAARVMLPAQHGLTDAPSRIRAYLRSNLVFLRDHPAHARALLEVYGGHRPQAGPPWDERSDAPAIDPLVDVLEAGQRAGEIITFDPGVMARTIRAAIDAVCLELGRDPDIDLDARADELVALFDRATGAAPELPEE